MQVVERSAIVSFTAAQMFALVDDVKRYPEFLPWCTASRCEVVSATERLASVEVARGVLRTEFTTRNTVTPSDASISMHFVDGPFRDLDRRVALRRHRRATVRACIFGSNSNSRTA